MKIALFGYSGHGYVVAEAVKLGVYELLGYYDKAKAAQDPFSLPYLGDEQQENSLQRLRDEKGFAVLGIGENFIRRRVMAFLEKQGIACAPIIHPQAILSAMATIGAGSFVAAGAAVNPMATIGSGVILNTGCIVEHECFIGDFVHIAPGAVLTGNVKVGEGSFVGASAVVKPGVRIGRNAMVGAGAVVLQDIPDGQTWVGNPAKELKK